MTNLEPSDLFVLDNSPLSDCRRCGDRPSVSDHLEGCRRYICFGCGSEVKDLNIERARNTWNHMQSAEDL
jgi:hypothetical protein